MKEQTAMITWTETPEQTVATAWRTYCYHTNAVPTIEHMMARTGHSAAYIRDQCAICGYALAN